jgi:competence protein ComEA
MVTISDRFLLAAAGAALIAAAFGVWLLIAPTSGATPAFEDDSVAFAHESSASALASGSLAPDPVADLVVDVEGGVARPGIVRLARGSRVADAILAAGGYSTDADLLGAAQINLAAPLSDGQQVLVPLRSAASVAPSFGTPAGNGSDRLVNLNLATPEQLDTLPGIGPVTVQKIVAARQERPFATLEELVERKVLTSSQLEKIRDLVTLV